MASFRLGGARLVLDPSGALWWPEQRLLVVADLHLEKGAAFARRGCLLPPYDTPATLARLEELLHRHRPRRVVSLGDGFHDGRGTEALDPSAGARLRALVAAVDWLWVRGNHDPEPPTVLGGQVLDAIELQGVLFRHAPDGTGRQEVAGHLHPAARLIGSRRRLRRPCFASDGARLLLPAFGAFTGGLNVLDPAIARLFPSGFDAFVTGEARVYRVPHHRLAPEAHRR
jgi:DNA ligase-associated metallophosphoesterase